MTITVDRVDAGTIGSLIALFERTVGLYASLVNINAYHQPGVEAGKKAAGVVISLQKAVIGVLRKKQGNSQTVMEIAAELGTPDQAESVFAILRHLAANPDRSVSCAEGESVESVRFMIS